MTRPPTMSISGFELQYYPVPAPNSELEVEARRLMLARVVAAPDAWRARATAAGGLLGAAGALAFVGLSSASDRFPAWASWVAGVSTVAYALAVFAFLAASVRRPPRPKSEMTTNYFDSTHDYAEDESRPIKCRVTWGAYAAATAIAGTAISSISLLLPPETRSGVQVTLRDRDDMAALKRLCPAVSDPFQATVSARGSDAIEVVVKDAHCSGGRIVFTVSNDAVTMLQKGESK